MSPKAGSGWRANVLQVSLEYSGKQERDEAGQAKRVPQQHSPSRAIRVRALVCDLISLVACTVHPAQARPSAGHRRPLAGEARQAEG